MAANIANVIGVKEKADGYYYNDNYIVSWCVGHLVELKDAAEYDEKIQAEGHQKSSHYARCLAVQSCPVNEETADSFIQADEAC